MKSVQAKKHTISIFLMFGASVVFGQSYTKLHDFGVISNDWPGSYRNTLMSDGSALYGTTWRGGTHTGGEIFKLNFDGSGYIVLHEFNSINDGFYPSGTLLSEGAYLYGVTNSGGNALIGTIFKIKPDGTGYTIIHHFSGGANGEYPDGGLISDGIHLYGKTNSNTGTIFKIKPDGTDFTIL